MVIGGIKIKDKIGALEKLLPKADKVLLGGGTAYTFLKASGIAVGTSPVQNEYLNWAANALSEYSDKIMLPEDHIVSSLSMPEKSNRSSSSGFTASIVKHIPEGMAGYDIGIETVLNTLLKSVAILCPERYFGMGQWACLKHHNLQMEL